MFCKILQYIIYTNKYHQDFQIIHLVIRACCKVGKVHNIVSNVSDKGSVYRSIETFQNNIYNFEGLQLEIISSDEDTVFFFKTIHSRHI